MMVDVSNDFALLSHDIIYDVLELGHRHNLLNVSLGGRWGEIAEKFSSYTIRGNGIEHASYEHGIRKEYLSLSVTNDSVSHTYIGENTDFSQLMHLAPKLYEHFNILTGKIIPNHFLEALGTRFTTISWSFVDNRERFSEGEIEFLKRQLQSPHLRTFFCDSPVLSKAEFQDLLVMFVTKSNFKSLELPTALISGRVYKEAYESWQHRKDHEHLRSTISTYATKEDLNRFVSTIQDFAWTTETQGNKTCFRYTKLHQRVDHYQMMLYYDEFKFIDPNLVELGMALSLGNVIYSN